MKLFDVDSLTRAVLPTLSHVQLYKLKVPLPLKTVASVVELILKTFSIMQHSFIVVVPDEYIVYCPLFLMMFELLIACLFAFEE